MRLHHPILSAVLAGCMAQAAAQPAESGGSHAYLIAGGYGPDSSQVQIERNSRFARQLLAEQSVPTRLWFGAGNSGGHDVMTWQPPAGGAAGLEPLARVFDSHWWNGVAHRPHELGEVAGSTYAPTLAADLGGALESLAAGDRALLMYFGHGGYDATDEGANNSLQVWRGTTLTVDDMDGILDRAPAEVPVRFLFTQCYSGDFTRLIYAGGHRCGFVSVPADRTAEGCSAALDRNDYQDYGGDFLSALAGRDRHGEPLKSTADRDGDGGVTLREAHLHALAHGTGSDLPRATSEVWLDRWLPWYGRPLMALLPVAEDDPYRQLERHLTGAILGDPELPEREGEVLRRYRDRLAQEELALMGRRQELGQRMDSLRWSVTDAVLARWPAANLPYTAAHHDFMAEHLDAAQAFIQAHEDYPALVAAQQGLTALEGEILDRQRRIARVDRLRWARHQAELRAVFDLLASDSERAAYQRLVACEDSLP